MPGTINPIAFIKSAYKNSPWIVISVAGHSLLFAGLGVFVISKHFETKPVQEASIAITSRPPPPPEIDVPDLEPPKLVAVPENVVAELAPVDVDLYVPLPDQPTEEDLHLEVGDPSGLDNLPPGSTASSSIGVGDGAIRGGGMPTAFSGRTGTGTGGGKGRPPRGQTVGTEGAVLDGLRWLVRHQNEDGSWGGDEFRSHCTVDKPCLPPEHAPTERFKEGLTGLALLCFLGQGLTHDSKLEVVDPALGRRHQIGDVVLKGLKWLRERQRPDGGFAATPGLLYNDILATMALT